MQFIQDLTVFSTYYALSFHKRNAKRKAGYTFM
jgi:hypothetical protein